MCGRKINLETKRTKEANMLLEREKKVNRREEKGTNHSDAKQKQKQPETMEASRKRQSRRLRKQIS